MLQSNLQHKYPPQFQDLMSEIDKELEKEKKEKKEKEEEKES